MYDVIGLKLTKREKCTIMQNFYWGSGVTVKND